LKQGRAVWWRCGKRRAVRLMRRHRVRRSARPRSPRPCRGSTGLAASQHPLLTSKGHWWHVEARSQGKTLHYIDNIHYSGAQLRLGSAAPPRAGTREGE
jgi:hypothetical protein